MSRVIYIAVPTFLVVFFLGAFADCSRQTDYHLKCEKRCLSVGAVVHTVRTGKIMGSVCICEMTRKGFAVEIE